MGLRESFFGLITASDGDIVQSSLQSKEGLGDGNLWQSHSFRIRINS